MAQRKIRQLTERVKTLEEAAGTIAYLKEEVWKSTPANNLHPQYRMTTDEIDYEPEAPAPRRQAIIPMLNADSPSYSPKSMGASKLVKSMFMVVHSD